MTKSVTFNGITRTIPGGISRVRTENIANVGNSARSVGLVGEADGGAPGSVDGLVSFRSPSAALEMYKKGPLLDNILLAFESSADLNVPGGAGEVVVYKTNNSTKSSALLPNDTLAAVTDIAAAGSTTTVVNLTTAGLTVDLFVGATVDIQILALTGTPTFRRTILSNTAGAITVYPALPQAPAAADPVTIRATALKVESRNYGLDTTSIQVDYTYSEATLTQPGGFQFSVINSDGTQLSPTLGDKQRMQIMYRGGTNAVAQDTVLNATVTNTLIPLTTGGLVAAVHVGATVVIKIAGLEEQVRIQSYTAGELTLYSTGISNQMVAAIKANPTSTATVDIKTVTNATVTVTGDNGVATGITTTIAGVSGDNLAITFAPGQTITQLATLINNNSNYVATIPANMNGNLNFCADLDFGYGAKSIQIQPNLRATTGSHYLAARAFTADIFDVVTWFNTTAEAAVASRDTTVNNSGSYLTLDDFVVGPLALTGGTRGTSSNSDFQAGLDAMLTRRVDYIVPLIDQDLALEGLGSTATWASVSQQLVSHVTEARGAAGLERGAFIGFRGNKVQYIDAANSLGDIDIQITSQYPTILDVTGTLVAKAPREFAVMGASMRAGVAEPGEPLTNKYIRCTALTQDNSWSPGDVTDATDLILNGCLFGVEKPGFGFRWVRDTTSYIKEDHLAYTEGSVRDIVRTVVYTLRTEIENKFTGRKATPITIASIKDFAASIFEQLRTDEYIVDSTDPVTGEVTRAYFGLRVTSNGDVVYLSAGFCPVPGINFQLNDLLVRIPTQSA